MKTKKSTVRGFAINICGSAATGRAGSQKLYIILDNSSSGWLSDLVWIRSGPKRVRALASRSPGADNLGVRPYGFRSAACWGVKKRSILEGRAGQGGPWCVPMGTSPSRMVAAQAFCSHHGPPDGRRDATAIRRYNSRTRRPARRALSARCACPPYRRWPGL